MVITKREDVTKKGFWNMLSLQKTPSSEKSLISTYSISMSGRGTGVGAYSRLGAY